MMTNKRRGFLQFALSLFLVVQMVIGYIGSIQTVYAAGPLNTDAPAAINVPQYNQGVDKSLEQYLCVPSDSDLGVALFGCISKLYRFGISFGAIALVFFLVFAGYMYITGGETGKQKGKSVFLSALTGMAIILSSYVLLGFINPELTKIKPIQAPIFDSADLPSCEEVGLGTTCVLPDGQVNTGTGGGASGPTGNVTGKGGAVCNAGKDTRPSEHASCSAAGTFQAAIAQAAKDNKLEEAAIKAIIQTESHFKPNAVGPTTRYGTAYGLMQMLPSTAASMGCTGESWKTDGNQNIKCGAKYMANIRDKYRGTSLRLIAAGYNAGPGRLVPSPNCDGQQVWECPFSNPAQTACNTGFNETRNYVVIVNRFYNEFKACK